MTPDPRVFDVPEGRLVWRAAGGYADTANYGLPHVGVLDAVTDALARWESGTSTITDWIEYCDRARTAFARLVRTEADSVSCASASSYFVGLVAASLPAGSEVLIPSNEFTSNVYPWLAQETRGVRVRTAAVADLPRAIDERTTIVAYSAVQSADGEVADVSAIAAAARAAGAQVLVDATQACGWMEIDANAADFLVCSAYKWLMAPRGCAFMAVDPAWLEAVRPSGANWFAGDDVSAALYGPPLRLARGARRLDLSPAWVNWAGAAAAVEAIEQTPRELIAAHDLGLAADLCQQLGLEKPASPIVSVPVGKHVPDLDGFGVKASIRNGALRVSFHLHNDLDDVSRIVEATSAARSDATRADVARVTF